MKLTLEQLKAKMAEQLEESIGMKAEDFNKLKAEHAELVKKDAEVNRQHTKEFVYQDMPSSYERKAKHVIKRDPAQGAGLRYARYVRATTLARLEQEPAEVIAKRWGDDWLAEDIAKARVQKALAAQTFASGGALVPDEYLGEIIELLRSRAVVRGMNPRIMPMRSGSMTMPKQTGAGTAAYIGENSNATKSEQTFGQIQLTAKKLAALTPVSNDLLRESDPAADMIVRDDLVAVMGLREDLAFIRGDGTANTPKGIRNWAATANVNARTQAGSASTTTEINNDLHKAIRLVKAANVPILNAGWLMSTRTASYLASLRESGLWMYKDEMSSGKLLGYPFMESNQIPETLNVSGAGTNDETEVYFVEFSQFVIGDTMSLSIETFPGGTYHDGSALVSGISQDQTVIRTISLHDCALRHDKAAAVITAVDWL